MKFWQASDMAGMRAHVLVLAVTLLAAGCAPGRSSPGSGGSGGFAKPIWTSGLIGSDRQHRKRQAKGKSPHRREHAGGYLNRKPAHVCQGRTVIKWSGWS